MKCSKCKDINIDKANYCKKYGYHFTENEQKKAHRKTLFGKLEMLEKAYSVCSLKIITDSLIFKIGSLLLMTIIGIMLFTNMENKLRILDSDNYQVQYNTKLDEYYLILYEDETKLNLYKPDNIKNYIYG